jgi:hypothetical protein
MIHIPVPPNLDGCEASILIDAIGWIIDALINWQTRITHEYEHWLEPQDPDWPCDSEN